MADNVNNNNGDIVNSRYPPKEYTAVPGQLLMPHLKKMKQAISDSKDIQTPNYKCLQCKIAKQKRYQMR